MRVWIIPVLGALVLATAAAYVTLRDDAPNTPAVQAESAQLSGPDSILGVDEFMDHVAQYSGHVQVQGVVSQVQTDQHMLSLVDTSEVQECGVTTCARLYLPVRWTEDMPSPLDVVLVSGQAQRSDGKLVFVASTLRKLPTRGEP